MDRIRLDQVRANAHCGGARVDEIGYGLLIYSSGRDQRHLREGGHEGLDIAWATDLRAGENFHKVGACPPRRQNFGGSQRSWYYRNVPFQAELHDLAIETGAGEKRRSFVEATMRYFLVEKRAGADDQVRVLPC